MYRVRAGNHTQKQIIKKKIHMYMHNKIIGPTSQMVYERYHQNLVKIFWLQFLSQ